MSSTNSTSTSVFPTISFGNNLLEISALTSLIGSATAESLVLGTRGAAGIAWSTTSAFGLLWVIKACISGASSGWLRESMGVRSIVSDQAVGMDLKNSSKRAGRVRANIGPPVGIFCNYNHINPVSRNGSNNARDWRDVYVFNRSHSTLLSTVPESEPGVFTVYSYGDYKYYRLHDGRFQSLVIALSLLKLVESSVLWVYNGALFALVSLLPWLYFFCVATYFEFSEILLSRNPEPEGEIDIIAGRLPNPTRPGGSRKIVLGAAVNPKTSMVWRSVWAIGAIVSILSLVLTYFLLGQQSQETGYIWAGFQIFWMLIRIVVHYFADTKDPLANRLLTERSPKHLSPEQRLRILDLAIDVGQYQTLVHPRGQLAYRDDMFNSQKITTHFQEKSFDESFFLMDDHTPGSPAQIEIMSVVGDSLLSSVAWITGSPLTPKDLYDSCIVTFASSMTQEKMISVPAARVLCGISLESIASQVPNEAAIPEFIPKGSPNDGMHISWWYFIPCTDGLKNQWLLVRRNAGTTIIGKSEVEVMSDSQITALFMTGKLKIGLRDVGDLKEIVRFSRSAGESLRSILH